MGNTTGVGPLFGEFRRHLKRNRKRLAPLHLVGRLEDYLTKEFANVILTASGGSVLPIGNYGHATDKRRIDLVLVKGNLSKALDRQSLKRARQKCHIYALLEMKYVRNTSGVGFANASDETSTAFKSLCKQLNGEINEEYAGYRVRLLASSHITYGVIFASFVRRADEAEKEVRNEAKFIRNTVKLAHDEFRSHNFKAPTLKEVYSRVPVTVLKGKFLVSLYAGLWRIKPHATSRQTKAMMAVSVD